ncbi:MrcB family domain-containing protein [Streptomyces sp. NPDC059209]|uniref:MrcB family domain-containing protein n=1 Tax=Streptomyces sp. NPDC059209 TaxID=3346769 RepID=UPI0036B0323D
MGMSGLLREIASTYDASAGTTRDVVGQIVLRGVARRTDLSLPPSLFAKGYGGQSSAAATPWIGVFDPAINGKPGEGLYLAYIFSADLKTVSLTLQQGITHLEDRLGRGKARQDHLRRQAERLRRSVARQRRAGWVDEPTLRHHADRPRAYEAASVIARSYDLAELPDDGVLSGDLAHAAGLLKRTAIAQEAWYFSDGDGDLEVNFAPDGHGAQGEDPLAGFHPKDSSDYVANIVARQQIKKRHHEKLIDSFGRHTVARGYTPTTHLMHPKDLVLHRTSEGRTPKVEWLVEAKVVRANNPTEAVRQVVGQLFEYSHFLYRERQLKEPHLIGLFTQDIGAYSGYLESKGIASIWQSDSGWGGSPSAARWEMTG